MSLEYTLIFNDTHRLTVFIDYDYTIRPDRKLQIHSFTVTDRRGRDLTQALDHNWPVHFAELVDFASDYAQWHHTDDPRDSRDWRDYED